MREELITTAGSNKTVFSASVGVQETTIRELAFIGQICIWKKIKCYSHNT